MVDVFVLLYPYRYQAHHTLFELCVFTLQVQAAVIKNAQRRLELNEATAAKDDGDEALADYNRLSADQQAHPELYEPFALSSWNRGVDLDRYTDVLMHLLFHGGMYYYTGLASIHISMYNVIRIHSKLYGVFM